VGRIRSLDIVVLWREFQAERRRSADISQRFTETVVTLAKESNIAHTHTASGLEALKEAIGLRNLVERWYEDRKQG
jgi:hypothetical protein